MVWKGEREEGTRVFKERLERGKMAEDSEIQVGG